MWVHRTSPRLCLQAGFWRIFHQEARRSPPSVDSEADFFYSHFSFHFLVSNTKDTGEVGLAAS